MLKQIRFFFDFFNIKYGFLGDVASALSEEQIEHFIHSVIEIDDNDAFVISMLLLYNEIAYTKYKILFLVNLIKTEKQFAYLLHHSHFLKLFKGLDYEWKKTIILSLIKQDVSNSITFLLDSKKLGLDDGMMKFLIDVIKNESRLFADAKTMVFNISDDWLFYLFGDETSEQIDKKHATFTANPWQS